MVKLRCYLRTILLIAIGLSWFSGAMADLNDGLVAYYPFDGNAQDASGNGNHGKEYGGIEYVDDGVIGKAVRCTNGGIKTLTSYFDKDIAYNRSEHTSYFHSIPQQSSSQTMSVWFKTSHFNTTDWGGVITGVAGIGSRFYISTRENFLFISYGDDNITKELRSIINDNTWHHVVLLSYGDTGEKHVYLDGDLKLSFANGDNKGSTKGYYTICGYSFYQGEYRNKYQGQVDDLRIYNRALTDSEIQQLYQMDNQPTDNCWAIYENGNLHIPCIKVKGPFDDDLHYEADMQYEPLSDPMTFQLTGAKPK